MRHQLRHLSASGTRLDATNVWVLDPTDGTILASIRVAAAPLVHCVIRVRGVDGQGRQPGVFAIVRLDTSTWAVEHGVFHPDLPAMGLLLTHAPSSDSEALSKLVQP